MHYVVYYEVDHAEVHAVSSEDSHGEIHKAAREDWYKAHCAA